MKYISASEASENWGLSERSVRNYCLQGRVYGAFQEDKLWYIPEDAEKPERKQRATKLPEDLLGRLKAEKEVGLRGGIYHRIQIDLTYNSNHMEGSRLTHDQTRCIFETNTIGADNDRLIVDDIVEAANHFRCVDLMIDMANYKVSESMLKQFHMVLKSGTSDSRKGWFAVGDYKREENEVGGHATPLPEEVPKLMKDLIARYNRKKEKTFEEILQFHYDFENIHPFQDGNGRVGRLIMFKECLRNGIVPFVIEDHNKLLYWRGLAQWKRDKAYLRDTCLSEQDKFKTHLDYFGIKYDV